MVARPVPLLLAFSLLVVGFPEAAWAGKQITTSNHAEWRWRTLETEHFAVHYPTSRRDPELSAETAARRVAAEADALWLRMGDALGWYPTARIHVVVVDDTDGLRAWSWPLRGAIVLSAWPGVELYRTRSRGDPLIDVFAHELAHVFLHKRTGSWSEAAGYGADLEAHLERGPGAVGLRLPLGPTLPQWWSEGGAEFLAAEVGHGWWSPARDAALRATVLEDRLLGWDELQVAEDKGDVGDGERAYQQGYALFRWLESREGAGSFSRLQALAAERGRVEPTSALRELTGVRPRALYAEHVEALRAGVGERVAERAALGLAEGRELWPWDAEWDGGELSERDAWEGLGRRDREDRREVTGAWNLHPTWSPDGRWLAEHRAGWVRVRRSSEGVWPALADRAPPPGATGESMDRTRGQELWIPGRFESDFAFVPGRDALVLSAPHPVLGWDADGWDTHRLVLVDLEPDAAPARKDLPDRIRGLARRATAIPGTERGFDPAVAPDGDRLAWVRVAAGRPELVVAELDGSASRVIASLPPGSWIASPSWSPSGDRLVAAVHHAHRNDLWWFAADGSGHGALTGDGYEEVDPVWTGEGILFAADVDGVHDIFLLDPEVGRVERLTRVRGMALTPSLTPAGHLLYAARTAHGWKSMALRRDGWLREPTEVFTFAPEEELPVVPALPELEARRYHVVRDALPVAIAPELRVHAEPSDLGASAGGWVLARDAAEEMALELWGVAGTDLAVSGALTVRALGPDLTAWASWEDDRRWLESDGSRRRVWADGLGLAARWDVVPDRLAVELDAGRRQVGWRAPASERLGRTWLAEGAVQLGSRRHRRAIGDQGADLRLGLVGARSLVGSAVEAEPASWTRTDTRGAATFDWGPLMVDTHGVAAFTVGTVPYYDRLRAGGDAPSARRLGSVEPAVAFPGFAPRSIAGDHLVLGGVGLGLPVRDLRVRPGPLYLDDLLLRVGGDVGRAWSAETPDGPVLFDAVGELRLAAVLGEQSWDSLLRIARGFGEPAATGDPTDRKRGEGALRWIVGLGTGW